MLTQTERNVKMGNKSGNYYLGLDIGTDSVFWNRLSEEFNRINRENQ